MGNGGGVVHKDEVRLGESEPVDVNLDDSNADDHNTLKHTCQLLQSKPNDHTYHDGTASQTTLGPVSIFIGRKEEQTSHTDTLNVKRHEDGPESLDVVQTASLGSVGLVSTPVDDILVGAVKKDEGDQGEHSDNRLDDRVDNGNANDKTGRREGSRPSEGVHFVLLQVNFSGSATGQNVTEQVHDPRNQTSVGLGGTGQGGGKDKGQEEDGSTRKLGGKQGGDFTGSVAQIAESIDQTGSKSDDKETMNDLEEPESAEEFELNVATSESAKQVITRDNRCKFTSFGSHPAF